MSKTYRLFISHSWTYSDAYDIIIKFLKQEGIEFSNHSVPKDDPVHTNGYDWELENAIDAKIKGVSCVLILAGVYSSYSKWIKKEIEIANKYEKPIIAIEPWDAKNTSRIVKDNADEIVKWQASSLAKAIRKLG